MLVQSDSLSFAEHVKDGSACLRVNSLLKTYQGRGNVIEDVSFGIMPGEAVALIGGNGSGKSTLLKCCLRLIEPDRGEIEFLNQKILDLNRAQLRVLRSRVGLVFQHHNLIPRLSVFSNVILGAIGRKGGLRTWRHCFSTREIREEAMACLEKVGLPHLAASRADMLSGGESQRVAIARALMQRPDFLIADEPVASLDPRVGREVMELFMELNEQERITFFYVSHDLDHAIQYSNRILALQHGRLIIDDRSSLFTKGELREIYH